MTSRSPPTLAVVLIRNAVLERIATGEIDTLFRRQVRPTVRAGGTLRTAIGMLDIVEVTPVAAADITLDDARRAGFASVDEVVAMLEQKADGTDYRVRVRPGGYRPAYHPARRRPPLPRRSRRDHRPPRPVRCQEHARAVDPHDAAAHR